jgi:hypothetical protein
MKVRNCLTCVNFANNMIFEYSKSGTIQNVSRIMKCNKLNLEFQLKNSEEKYTNEVGELHFITNKCYKAKHYQKVEQINPYKVICKDV